MDESCVVGRSFILRSGTPQPQKGCPSGRTTKFVMQTFGGKIVEKRVLKAATKISVSNDMVGLNPEGKLTSASYQGTQYISKDGEMFLTGEEVFIATYVDEDQIPGVSNINLVTP